MDHLQGWTGGAGGPFKVMGLYGSAGFSGGTSGGGSGSPRPITISSIFKISESILVRIFWLVSVCSHSFLEIVKSKRQITLNFGTNDSSLGNNGDSALTHMQYIVECVKNHYGQQMTLSPKSYKLGWANPKTTLSVETTTHKAQGCLTISSVATVIAKFLLMWRPKAKLTNSLLAYEASDNQLCD